MADSAQNLLTVEEFLAWESGDDYRYELWDGRVVMMAPPSPSHAALIGELVGRLFNAIRSRPECRVLDGAGLRSLARARSFYIPDILVTCTRSDIEDGEVRNPILVIEVLSPSTERGDRRRKLVEYRAVPSVREIVLIDCRQLFAEIHRRDEGGRWFVDVLGEPEARLRLESAGLDVSLDELYRGLPLEEAAS